MSGTGAWSAPLNLTPRQNRLPPPTPPTPPRTNFSFHHCTNQAKFNSSWVLLALRQHAHAVFSPAANRALRRPKPRLPDNASVLSPRPEWGAIWRLCPVSPILQTILIFFVVYTQIVKILHYDKHYDFSYAVHILKFIERLLCL